MKTAHGWHSRGYLPHVEAGSVTQFVTFRLADTVPKELFAQWLQEVESLPEGERKRELHRKIEGHLDSGYGSCLLANPVVAKIVQDTILMYGEDRYDLHAWVVMENHVHILVTPRDGVLLSKIMQSIKGFSANRINNAMGTSGRVWQPESFDRAVRDRVHFDRILEYIEWNPVKAKLCTDPKRWPYSSANERNRKYVRQG